MRAEHVAQVSKLHAAVVDATEPQRRLGGRVVDVLQFGVAPENVQHGAVGFPQKLERGHQQGRIALRFGRVRGHGRQQNGLR